MKTKLILATAFVAFTLFSCKKEIPGPKGDKGDTGDPGPGFKTYYFKSDFPVIGYQKLGDYDETKDVFDVYLMTDSFPTGTTTYKKLPCSTKAWIAGFGQDSILRKYDIKITNSSTTNPTNLIFLDVTVNDLYNPPKGQGLFKVVIFKGK